MYIKFSYLWSTESYLFRPFSDLFRPFPPKNNKNKNNDNKNKNKVTCKLTLRVSKKLNSWTAMLWRQSWKTSPKPFWAKIWIIYWPYNSKSLFGCRRHRMLSQSDVVVMFRCWCYCLPHFPASITPLFLCYQVNFNDIAQ